MERALSYGTLIVAATIMLAFADAAHTGSPSVSAEQHSLAIMQAGAEGLHVASEGPLRRLFRSVAAPTVPNLDTEVTPIPCADEQSDGCTLGLSPAFDAAALTGRSARLRLYYEQEPGKAGGGAPPDAATKLGASPPTSPSCRSRCAERTIAGRPLTVVTVASPQRHKGGNDAGREPHPASFLFSRPPFSRYFEDEPSAPRIECIRF